MNTDRPDSKSARPAKIDREAVQESMRRVGEAARAAHARGICVVPPRTHVPDSKKKRPIGDWKKHQTERPSAEMIAGWYGPNYGLGFVCGAISGNLECFEFDDRDTYNQFLSAAAEVGLAELVNRVASGYEEESPSGGIHWMFYCPEIRGNTKLAARPGPPDDKGHPTVKTLIETRGEGGYVVVAPSFGPVHPTGKPYRLVRGGIGQIVTLTPIERDSLWGLARTFEEVHPEAERQEHEKANGRAPRGLSGKRDSAPGSTGQRPGDDFAARTSWAEILDPAGWRKTFERDGTTYWTRPGKSPGAGHSATTGHGGGDCLHVFSSSTEFEPGRSYTKFAAFCVLGHNGDMAAGAKALAGMGFGGGPSLANGCQANGQDKPALDIASIQNRTTALVNAADLPALYRDKAYLTDLARLEAQDPAEAEAVKATLAGLKGFTVAALKRAVEPFHQAIQQEAIVSGPNHSAIANNPDDRPTFEFTDAGNARRLVAKHGNRIRFCKPYDEWLIYDGRRWKKDDRIVIEALAQEVPGLVLTEILPSNNPADREPFIKWATASQAKDRMTALIRMARSMVTLVPSELDLSPWLLNLQNGTIDLASGEFRPHRYQDMMTKIAPVAYIPGVQCPHFEKFVYEIMNEDEDSVDYLQRAIGYAATGVVRQHVFFCCYGTGSNGKSLLFQTLNNVLGDYATEIDSDLLIAQSTPQHPTGLTELEGRRLIVAEETEDSRRLAEAMVKKLTGGNMIQARRMHQDFYYFKPTHHVFLATNHKPDIRNMDVGIWRRIKLIPFEVCFEVTSPSWCGRHPDLELPANLASESSGILNWIIEGCQKWQKRGLAEPPAIIRATSQYRQEMDTLGWYLDERCKIEMDRGNGKPVQTPFTSLYSDYTEWCKTAGIAHPVGSRKFGSDLTAKGYPTHKSHSVTYKLGLRLKTTYEQENDRQRGGEDNEAPAY